VNYEKILNVLIGLVCNLALVRLFVPD